MIREYLAPNCLCTSGDKYLQISEENCFQPPTALKNEAGVFLDMQGLKKFKTQAPFLKKHKMYFTKMRKLTKKEEDTGNRKAETGQRQRKSHDLMNADPCVRPSLVGSTRRQPSVQASAGHKPPGDASSKVSACIQMNFRQLVKN